MSDFTNERIWKKIEKKKTTDDKVMRSFDTGATRDTADGKLDYEGFLSPAVLKQFAKFMNMNRLQSDGQLRDSDNWQKGIPMDVYMKSGFRHFNDWWTGHRYGDTPMIDRKPTMAALCGLLFNVMGYMHEELKRHPEVDFDGDEPTPEMKERQMILDRCHDCGCTPCRCTPEDVPEDEAVKRVKDTLFPEEDMKFLDTDVPENIATLEQAKEDEMKYPQELEGTFCGNDEVAENCKRCNVGMHECKFVGKDFPEAVEEELDLTGLCGSKIEYDCSNKLCALHNQCIDTIIKRYQPDFFQPQPEPVKFTKAGCNGCISRLKSFSAYPCVGCVRNSLGSPDGHDYYQDGEC